MANHEVGNWQNRKGIPNKHGARIKKALALFAERNVDKTFKWIEQIADGQKDENGEWINKPNPKGAFECFMGVCEYHLPKISRVEHTGKDGEQLTISNILQSIETPVIPNTQELDVIDVQEDIDMDKLISHGITDQS